MKRWTRGPSKGTRLSLQGDSRDMVDLVMCFGAVGSPWRLWPSFKVTTPSQSLFRVDFFFLFFWEVGPNWDTKIQTRWPFALYFPFKFIGGYLGVQHPYRGPRYRSASSLLFVSDASWQSPRSASLPFPTLGIRIECVPTFPFQHRIFCMWESLLPSSCAACTG